MTTQPETESRWSSIGRVFVDTFALCGLLCVGYLWVCAIAKFFGGS